MSTWLEDCWKDGSRGDPAYDWQPPPPLSDLVIVPIPFELKQPIGWFSIWWPVIAMGVVFAGRMMWMIWGIA